MTLIIKPSTHITLKKTDSKKAIGEQLWESLNLASDSITLSRDIFSLVIESSDTKILQLPWELL